MRFAPDNNILFTVGRNLVRFNSDNNSEETLKALKSKITGIHIEGNIVMLSGSF